MIVIVRTKIYRKCQTISFGFEKEFIKLIIMILQTLENCKLNIEIPKTNQVRSETKNHEIP